MVRRRRQLLWQRLLLLLLLLLLLHSGSTTDCWHMLQGVLAAATVRLWHRCQCLWLLGCSWLRGTHRLR